MPAKRLSHYELLDKLGEGGMGALYRARDTRLNRTVAIKVLRAGSATDPDMARRLLQEARAASQLSDPRIVTIYEVDESPGREFIAMEFVPGEPLSARLSRGPLPLDEAVNVALECAEALAAAHAAGIVHRDLKPANVMLASSGHVKLLDFGLAKVGLSSHRDVESQPTLEAGPHTRTGAIVGTPAYMSPEQAEGRKLDARSDIFSFGVLLYELVAGKRPFHGGTDVVLLAAILHDAPTPVADLRPDLPADLARIVERCLEKKPESRYDSAEALVRELRACQERLARAPAVPWWKRPTGLSVAAVVVVAVVALATAGFVALRLARERAARQELAAAEALRLTEGPYAAYVALQELKPMLGGDPAFERVWAAVNLPMDVRTEPEGAEVAIKDYTRPDAPWQRLGRTPLAGVFVPFACLRWRFVSEGFDPLEVPNFDPRENLVFRLSPVGSAPPGMARVPAGRAPDAPIDLPETWLDVHEVTNRQYKDFVDQGGYRSERYWREPFVRDGRTLAWSEAMALFRDSTGRPGPATWELESYPEGQVDFPVGGVSWYEAAAYAAFAGKRLPTFHEWYRAAGQGFFSEVLSLSNFRGRGPERVGSSQGLTAWGHLDMAGNVKEWVSNATAAAGGARRFALGGAWNDASYLFGEPDAADPFDRRPVLGFRCARSEEAPPPAALGPVERVVRDYTTERPVGDETFATYARLFAYDPAPLDVRREGPDEEAEDWRMERLSFASTYGERIPARLYLPRRGTPPYQAVLYFPSGVAQIYPSAERLPDSEFAFLIRSGRAVLCPVYQNTLQRYRPNAGPLAGRDYAIQGVKDARRAVDFLASRPDVDPARLGYFGISLGAGQGLRVLAVEPRLRAAVLAACGLSRGRGSPELDRLNYAPRIRQPVLLVNGRDDFLIPLESCQRPLLTLLGAPEKDKKLVVLEGGHVLPRSKDLVREALDWFDRHLGPVTTAE